MSVSFGGSALYNLARVEQVAHGEGGGQAFVEECFSQSEVKREETVLCALRDDFLGVVVGSELS